MILDEPRIALATIVSYSVRLFNEEGRPIGTQSAFDRVVSDRRILY